MRHLGRQLQTAPTLGRAQRLAGAAEPMLGVQSGLVLWLRNPSGTNGATLQTWSDSSGNGRDATQSTANLRPLLRNGAANGYSTARATSGGGQYYTLPAGVSINRQTHSAWVVFRPVSTQADQVLLGLGSGLTGLGVYQGKPDYLNDVVHGVPASAQYVPARWNTLGVNCSAGGATQYFNDEAGVALGGGAGASATLTGGTVFILPGGGSAAVSDIAEIILYNRTLTADEVVSVRAYLNSKYGSATVPPRELLAVGDSLTSGYSTDGSGLYPNWAQELGETLNGYDLYVLAQSGYTITDVTNAASRHDAVYNATRYPTKRVLAVWAGTNDIYNGVAAATAYNNLVSYCQARQAAGWTVLVGNLIARTGTGPQNTARLSYNSSIASGYASFATDMVDLAAIFTDHTDATKYIADGVHLNHNGHSLVAAAFAAKVNGV